MSLEIKSRRSKRSPSGGGGLRGTVTTIVILLLLVVIAGFVYTWWVGRQQVVLPAAPTPRSAAVQTKPVEVVDTAPVGISAQTITSPVVAGSNASISIKTNPKANCSIRVEYNEAHTDLSTDLGLVPKAADEYGLVTWSWKVEVGRRVGKWPANITCANAKHSALYIGYFEIVNKTE